MSGSACLSLARCVLRAPVMLTEVPLPGLPSHPQHELAKRQMRGFGGMITFYVKVSKTGQDHGTLYARGSHDCDCVQGGLEGARLFLENVKVFTLAESLGAVESLAESP